MLGKNNKIVLYLTSNLVSIYVKEESDPLVITLDEGVFRYKEVVDKDTLEKLIKQLIVSNKLVKKKITIVVGEDLTFYKKVPLTPKVDSTKIMNDFLDTIPLEKENVLHKLISDKENTIVYATNKTYIQTITNGIKNAKSKVTSVIPLVLITDKELTPTTTKKLFKFVTSKPKSLNQIAFINEKKSKGLLWAFIMVVILMVAVGTVLYLQIIPNNVEKELFRIIDPLL